MGRNCFRRSMAPEAPVALRTMDAAWEERVTIVSRLVARSLAHSLSPDEVREWIVESAKRALATQPVHVRDAVSAADIGQIAGRILPAVALFRTLLRRHRARLADDFFRERFVAIVQRAIEAELASSSQRPN